MISSLGALLRTSLRRSRADWPIVLATGVMCTLAATLLSAGVMYGDAVASVGLHRTLADSPVTKVNVQVAARTSPEAWPALDTAIGGVLDQTFAVPGATIVRVGRSDSFALPDQPADAVRDLVTVGFAEGIETHATLVDGAWPTGVAGIGDPVPVAIAETVVASLGLHTGDRLDLTSRLDAALVVPVQVVAVFHIDDPAAAFWWNDPQVLEGVQSSERFVTYGPFLTTQANVLTRATASQIGFAWRALPDVGRVTPDGVAELRSRVEAIGNRIAEVTGGSPSVDVSTDLSSILQRVERSLLVSRAGVLILTLQLVILAIYAVLLSAALLVEHRRVDTMMLRSRGAGPYRIAEMAASEGLVLVIAAVLVGPWLALGVLRLFDLVGPLAEIGLRLQPGIGTDAYLAAAAAGVLCLVALTLPAFLSARSFAAVRGGLARGPTRNVGQRLGLDLALLVVAGIGLVQLRQYGATLTASVKGTLGLDPLLIATPAIGLLAGAIVALRLIPLGARILERATVRGRGLVPSLSARQVARRPLRYTRAALLLTLAMSMGVFAVSYAATWTTSQEDQARYQVGADVRVVPSRLSAAVPGSELARLYGGLHGVRALTPVTRESALLSTGFADLIGIDSEAAPSVVTMRPDLADASLTDLFAPLAAARPATEAVRLPGEPRQLLVRAGLVIRALKRPDGLDTTVATSVVGDWPGIDVSVVVRDALGTLYRFVAPTTTLTGADPAVIALGSNAPAPGASLAYPLDLLAVEVDVSLPAGFETPDATLAVMDVEAGSDGGVVPVPLGLASGWRATTAYFGQPARLAAAQTEAGRLAISTGVPAMDVIPTRDRLGRGLVVGFAPAALSTVDRAAIPVVATDAFFDATGRSVGDTLSMTIAGVPRSVRLAGRVATFPTTDASRPIVVMDGPTLGLLRFEGAAAVDAIGEWWLAVDRDRVDAVTGALRAEPIASASVISQVERARALASDPVALGVIGALAIGFVAAAVFAVLGFVVNAAVTARERVTEFALLRAVGLSSGQLSAWLSLESAGLAAISLVAGTGLGLLLAWVVLPFVTVTQGAVAPVPPVEVQVPWPAIGLLVIVSVAVFAVTVFGLATLLRRIGLASALRVGED